MTFILVTRNPRTRQLIAITGEDQENLAEFPTESEARAVAMALPLCEAWGFEAVEVTLPIG
jgi:hypothetical protein